MKKTFIYGLTDPRDKRIRYVGKSDNPIRRLHGHMAWKQQATSPKSRWIRELRRLNLKPSIEILAEVSVEEWKEQEQEWIKKLEHLGLVNGINGKKARWYSRSSKTKRE